MKKIILINGAKRSGKDFTASLLEKQLRKKGKSVEIFHYADPLKRIIAVTLGITLDELEYYKNEEDRFKINIVDTKNGDYQEINNCRKILQQFGTEAMKPIFGNKVWGKLMVDKINLSKAEYIIIPDFRFTEEYFILSDNLENVEIETIFLLSSCENYDCHPSEVTPDINFDYTIDNSKQDDTVKEWVNNYV